MNKICRNQRILQVVKHKCFGVTYNLTNSSQIRMYCNKTNQDVVDKPNYEMANPFEKDKLQCILCKMDITPNYKNVKLLSQFQSPFTGRIYGRHITGLCTHKQKQVETEIIKAQNAGLMGYYNKEVTFMKDPKLFDPENPIRPHRF